MISKEYNEAAEAIDEMFTDFNDHPDFPRAGLAIGEQSCKHGISIYVNAPNQAKTLFGNAIKVCDMLINELPDSPLVPEACRGMGYCYFRLGKPQDAIPWFQKVVDEYPQAEFAWSAQSWVGDCYEQLKISGAMPEPNATAQMEAAYQAVIENYPGCPSEGPACLKLAKLYFSQNDPAEAAYYLELFLEERPVGHPLVPKVLYDLAGAYEQMGELDSAAEIYGRFIQADPNNPLVKTAKAKLEKLARRSSGGLEGADK